MKISYPKGSIQCIVAGGYSNGFQIWCENVTYDFHSLRKTANSTMVQCKALGISPADGLGTYITGTIVYYLDGSYPCNEGPSKFNFLIFSTNIQKHPVEIAFEIEANMFKEAFTDNEQRLLRHQPPETIPEE
jgi:hypothetical protein